MSDASVEIRQGDIFWINLAEPAGSEPGNPRPFVIIQNNLLNRSRIRTVIVCGLTSNLRRAMAPGNVLLDIGECRLPRQSVVNVSQILTVDRTDLGVKIGTLSPRRVREILDGIRFILEPRETESE